MHELIENLDICDETQGNNKINFSQFSKKNISTTMYSEFNLVLPRYFNLIDSPQPVKCDNSFLVCYFVGAQSSFS